MQVLLVLLGDGVSKEALIRQARERGLDNVQFLPPVPKTEVPAYLSAADATFASLCRAELLQGARPNKVFDYMACGRPVICCIDGEARRLVVDEARAGVFAEPEDGAALAEAIRHLQSHPGQGARYGENGRRYVEQHCSRARWARRLAEVLQGAVGRKEA